jgi:hypothetical protein
VNYRGTKVLTHCHIVLKLLGGLKYV